MDHTRFDTVKAGAPLALAGRLYRQLRELSGRPASPFLPGRRRLLVHGCYHRVGTVWFMRIFQRIAARYRLDYRNTTQDELAPETEIFQQMHSRIDTSALPSYVGSHMIRDPRDVVVSGYHYHLWTDESWAHEPRPEYEGRSYQETLNAMDPHDGLLLEIERTAPNVVEMAEWDYGDPRIMELRYEDLIADEQGVFARVFEHYGFHAVAVRRCLEIAEGLSFERVTGRHVGESEEGSHLRSGKPGEWREHFTKEHKARFEELLPGALVALGYETTADW